MPRSSRGATCRVAARHRTASLRSDPAGGDPGGTPMWLLGRVRPAELPAVGRPPEGDPNGRSGRSSTLALLRPGVLLALRFLALSLHARLLVVLASASLGEDAA